MPVCRNFWEISFFMIECYANMPNFTWKESTLCRDMSKQSDCPVRDLREDKEKNGVDFGGFCKKADIKI